MKLLKLFILLILIPFYSDCQTREKSMKSVIDYIINSNKDSDDYFPIKFHEIIKQDSISGNIIKQALKSDQIIKYTVNHSYKINDSIIESDYFHLNSDYDIIGLLTKTEMLELSNLYQGKLIITKQESDSKVNLTEIKNPSKSKNGLMVIEKNGYLMSIKLSRVKSFLDKEYFSNEKMYYQGSTDKKLVKLLQLELENLDSETIYYNSLIENINKNHEYKNIMNDSKTLKNKIIEKYLPIGKINISAINNKNEIKKIVEKKIITEFNDFIRTEYLYLINDEIVFRIPEFDDYTKK